MHSLTFVDGRFIVGNLYECFETKYEGEYNGRYQSADSFQMTKRTWGKGNERFYTRFESCQIRILSCNDFVL